MRLPRRQINKYSSNLPSTRRSHAALAYWTLVTDHTYCGLQLCSLPAPRRLPRLCVLDARLFSILGELFVLAAPDASFREALIVINVLAAPRRGGRLVALSLGS